MIKLMIHKLSQHNFDKLTDGLMVRNLLETFQTSKKKLVNWQNETI